MANGCVGVAFVLALLVFVRRDAVTDKRCGQAGVRSSLDGFGGSKTSRVNSEPGNLATTLWAWMAPEKMAMLIEKLDKQKKRFLMISISRHTRTYKTKMTPNAITDKIPVISVQVRSVVASSMPRYSLTSQKPLSLTCESVLAPAATAKTISAICVLESDRSGRVGARKPAAVIIATVAEPCKTRTNAARIKASKGGSK